MTTFVPACITLLTVPPFPAPSSFRTTRSSLFRSSLNSRPISRVSVPLPSVFPNPPGKCESPSEGFDVFEGGAFRARPLTFLRFKVLALNGSDIVRVERQLGTLRCQILNRRAKEGWISDPTRACVRERGYWTLLSAATGGVVQE